MNATTSISRNGVEVTTLDFTNLDGWPDEDHEAALDVFRITSAPDSGLLRAVSARAYFEKSFVPVLIRDDRPSLFTGYYEPELLGSRERTERFTHPIYKCPPELSADSPWLTRKQIEESGILYGRDLEIAWIEDPLEGFLLQVQGSGRITLENGDVIRVGFAGKNGHPYKSIGAELIRRGIIAAHKISSKSIREWARANRSELALLLQHNESYVFFREVAEGDDLPGPIGSLGQPVTKERSVAVDPSFVPLGSPVWITTNGLNPIRRLMIAQDTGSAIKGAQRADIFFGTGAEAGEKAGAFKETGRLITLMPRRDADNILQRLSA